LKSAYHRAMKGQQALLYHKLKHEHAPAFLAFSESLACYMDLAVMLPEIGAKSDLFTKLDDEYQALCDGDMMEKAILCRRQKVIFILSRSSHTSRAFFRRGLTFTS